MTGKVTIQWCPSCQAWGKSKCVGVDVLEGLTEIDKVGIFAFDYRRENLRCDSCDGIFIKSSLKNRDSQQLWSVGDAVEGFRKSLDAHSDVGSIQFAPALTEHHGELAEGSNAFVAP
jgi:hypothetical protein